MINEGKEIKIYGTLVNHTVDTDSSHVDSIHKDKLSYAKQLYDDLFGEEVWLDNYQDIINKRVKGITRNTKNPKKGTHVNEDLYVEENLYVEGDVYITGTIHGVKLNDLDDVDAEDPQNGQLLAYDKNNKIWKPADITVEDITNLINRIKILESMWEHYTKSGVTYIRPKKIDGNDVPVLGPGFYDSTVS